MVEKVSKDKQEYTCPLCHKTRKNNGKWCLYCSYPHKFESEQHRQQWEAEHDIKDFPKSVIVCRVCGRFSFLEGNGMCKSCYCRRYQKTHPDKKRAAVLKYEFGVTKEWYDLTLVTQGDFCAICGKTPEENGRRLAVDHDHDTGKIRGLLCTTCNMMLGYAQDDPEILLSAIDYLTKVKEQ